MISSRRLALVSLVFVFGAAACGSQSPSTSGTTPGTEVTVPASTTTLPVIHLAASGRNASGGGAASTAPMAAEADSKLMPIMAATDFVYDGDLPALDGSAASWFFGPGQQPDRARIAALAASFGITGDVRELPADQGGGWAVGPADFSGPVLSVGSDGMSSWWLSAAPMPAIAGCAIPVDSGGGAAGSEASSSTAAPADTLPPEKIDPSAPDCTPQPPQNVPTADEALAKAKDLFTSWGYDLSSYEFDTPYADEWSASVNAWLLVDGMRTPLQLSVGFGENGTVTWASGSLATPQRGPDFPIVGAAAGLQRLKDQQGQWAAYSTGIATREVAPAAGEATGAATDAVSGTAASGTGVATPDIAIAPPLCTDTVDATVVAPDCTVAPVEPITVHLNSVKTDLTMVWADDNTIWLLPAYTFSSADGGLYSVMAVDDAYIQQPAVEPATTEPTGAEPVNVPETAVAPPAPVSAP